MSQTCDSPAEGFGRRLTHFENLAAAIVATAKTRHDFEGNAEPRSAAKTDSRKLAVSITMESHSHIAMQSFSLTKLVHGALFGRHFQQKRQDLDFFE